MATYAIFLRSRYSCGGDAFCDEKWPNLLLRLTFEIPCDFVLRCKKTLAIAVAMPWCTEVGTKLRSWRCCDLRTCVAKTLTFKDRSGSTSYDLEADLGASACVLKTRSVLRCMAKPGKDEGRPEGALDPPSDSCSQSSCGGGWRL